MGEKQAPGPREAQRLLRQAKAFDRHALAAIYDTYHGPIYGYIYRQVGDVEVARDLSADVFARLLQGLRGGAGPNEHLKAWLYRTAHNVVVDYYRRQSHRNHLPLTKPVTDVNENPAQRAELNVAADGVRWAIRQLTPDQQQVIALRFLSGMSNAETAAILDKPVGAIKSLQHRALATLRRLLDAEKEHIS